MYAHKTHPCGAPAFTVMVEDISDSVCTYCCLFVRTSRTNSCNLAGMLYSASLFAKDVGLHSIKGRGIAYEEGSCVLGVPIQVLCYFLN